MFIWTIEGVCNQQMSRHISYISEGMEPDWRNVFTAMSIRQFIGCKSVNVHGQEEKCIILARPAWVQGYSILISTIRYVSINQSIHTDVSLILEVILTYLIQAK